MSEDSKREEPTISTEVEMTSTAGSLECAKEKSNNVEKNYDNEATPESHMGENATSSSNVKSERNSQKRKGKGLFSKSKKQKVLTQKEDCTHKSEKEDVINEPNLICESIAATDKNSPLTEGGDAATASRKSVVKQKKTRSRPSSTTSSRTSSRANSSEKCMSKSSSASNSRTSSPIFGASETKKARPRLTSKSSAKVKPQTASKEVSPCSVKSSRGTSRTGSLASSTSTSPVEKLNQAEKRTESRPSPKRRSRGSSGTNSKEQSPTSARGSCPASSRSTSCSNSRASSPIPGTSGTQTMLELLTDQLNSLKRSASQLKSSTSSRRLSRKKRSTARSTTPSKRRMSKSPTRSPSRMGYKRRRTPLKSPRGRSPKKSPFLQVKLPAVLRKSPTKKSVRRRLETSPVNLPKRGFSPVKPPRRQTDTSLHNLSTLSCDDIKEIKDDLRLSSSSDDEEEDSLTIIAGEEQELLDKILDEKSDRIDVNITARNVKSIIHQVITNEHVLDMVRNTLQEEGLEEQLKEAIFEPKMTRSKVKEVMEKGALPPHWTLSPIKCLPEAQKEPPHFLEMNFSDNEAEDDEYKPSKEELEGASDDDDESVSTSVFGSPMPSTAPMTPCSPYGLTTASEDEPTPKPRVTLANLPPVKIPANTSAGTSADTSSKKQGSDPSRPETTSPGNQSNRSRAYRNLWDDLQASDLLPPTPMTESERRKEEEAELVAQRTRSKMPLKDTPLEEIESNFVAPDITADMYDTSYVDQDWHDFLNNLTKSHQPDLNDTTEDDPNDPEYNFMAEAQKTKEDVEDFRDDRAVRIPKKELTELMDELFEAHGGMASAILNGEDAQASESPVITPGVTEMQAKAEDGTAQNQTEQRTGSTCDPDDLSGQGQGHLGKQDLEPESEATTAATSQYPGHIPPLRMDPGLVSIFVSDLLKITGKEDQLPVPVRERQTVPSEGLKLSNGELYQLHDQMRKHVQLLAQTFVQVGGQSELAEIENKTKLLLMDLLALGNNSTLPEGTTSAFHPINLSGTLDIISRKFNQEDSGERSRKAHILRHQIMQKCEHLRGTKLQRYLLSYEQMEVFCSSPVFLFPQMLPEVRLQNPEAHSRSIKRVTFTDAEDVLLAMGLEQFRYVANKFMWIQKCLLPTKAMQQLKLRVKNLRGNRCGTNVVKTWLQESRLPDLPRYEELEQLSEIVSPQDRDPDLMPEWWLAFDRSRAKIQGKAMFEDSDNGGSDSDLEVKKNHLQTSVSSQLDQLKKKPAIGVSSLKDITIFKTEEAREVPASQMIRVSDGETLQLPAAETNDAQPPESPAGNETIVTTPQQVLINPAQIVSTRPGSESPVFFFTPQQLQELGIQVQVPPGGVPVLPPAPSTLSASSPVPVQGPVLALSPQVASISEAAPQTLFSPIPVNTSTIQNVLPIASPAGSVQEPRSTTPMVEGTGSPVVYEEKPTFGTGPPSVASPCVVAQREVEASPPVSQEGSPVSMATVADPGTSLSTSLASISTKAASSQSDEVKSVGDAVLVSNAGDIEKPETVTLVLQTSDIGPVVSLTPMTQESGKEESVNCGASNIITVTGVPSPAMSPALESVSVPSSVATAQPTGPTIRRVHPVFAKTKTKLRRRLPPKPVEKDAPLIGQPAVLGIPCLPVSRTTVQPVAMETSTNKPVAMETGGATSEQQKSVLLSMPDIEGFCEQEDMLPLPAFSQNVPLSSTPKSSKRPKQRPTEAEEEDPEDLPDFTSPSRSLIRHAFSEAMGIDPEDVDSETSMVLAQAGAAKSPAVHTEELLASVVSSPAVTSPPDDLTVVPSPVVTGQLGDVLISEMAEAPSQTLGEPPSLSEMPNLTTKPPGINTQDVEEQNPGTEKASATEEAPPSVNTSVATTASFDLNISAISTASTAVTETSALSEIPKSEESSFCILTETESTLREHSIDFSDVDLELPAGHSDAHDPKTQDIPQFTSVTTPQKLTRLEYSIQDRTPVKSDFSESENSLGFGDSPGGSSLRTPTSTPGKGGETPTKKAIQWMAQLAQLITPTKSPARISTALHASVQARKKSLFRSPPKKVPEASKSPLKILPNQVLAVSPVKPLSPLAKVKKSPRRKLLQQRARDILPKGFIVTVPPVSPVKKAAASLTAKAKRGGNTKRSVMRKLLPKILESEKLLTDGADAASEYETVDSEDCSDLDDDNDVELEEEGVERLKTPLPVKKPKKRARRKVSLKPCVESPSENEDSNEKFSEHEGELSQDEIDDEDHLAELMAASTTIGFTSKKGIGPCSDSLKRNKTQQKKDVLLKMLAADLVDSDPLRDERDTAFAQDYMLKVREALKHDREKYGQFLQILHEFGSNERTPVNLYQELETLFADLPDLLYDFAGFLLPDQAKECGCLMANLEFDRIRTFLRKLEVNFQKHPSHLQKILKVFSQWQSSSDHNADDLKDSIRPLLRGQQHLLDEFCLFFDDEKPPESHMTEFETVTLDDSDGERSVELDDFEEVTLPEEEGRYQGSRWCRCHCHTSNKKKYSQRKRHCLACGLKVINGRLYLRTTEKNLRPLHVIVHGRPPPPRPASDDEESLHEGEVVSDEDEVVESIPEILDEELDGEGDPEVEDPDEDTAPAPGVCKTETTFQDEVNENIRPPKRSIRKAKKLKLKPVSTVCFAGGPTATASRPTVAYISEDSILPEGSSVSGQTSARSVEQVSGVPVPTDFSALHHHIQKPAQKAEEEDEEEKENEDEKEEHLASRETLAKSSISTIQLNSGAEVSNEPGQRSSSSSRTAEDSPQALDSNSAQSAQLSEGAQMDTDTDSYLPPGDHASQVQDLKLKVDRGGRESGSRETQKLSPTDSISRTAEVESKDGHTVISVKNEPGMVSTSRLEATFFAGKLLACGKAASVDAASGVDNATAALRDDAGEGVAEAAPASETCLRDCQLFVPDSASQQSSSLDWDCEEDKVILETCKELGPSQTTFCKITEELTDKTPDQISARFLHLIQLFESQLSSEETEHDSEEREAFNDLEEGQSL